MIKYLNFVRILIQLHYPSEVSGGLLIPNNGLYQRYGKRSVNHPTPAWPGLRWSPRWNGHGQGSLDGGEPAEEPAVSIAGNLPSEAKKSHPQGGDVVQNLIWSHIRDAERGHSREGASPTALHPEGTGGGDGESCRPLGSAGLPMLQRPRSGETTQCRSQRWRHSALRGCSLEKATPRRRLRDTAPAGEEHWTQCTLQDQQGPLEPRRGKNSLPPPVPHQTLQPVRLNIMAAGKEEIFTKSTSMVTWKAKKHRFGAEENKLTPGIFVFIT